MARQFNKYIIPDFAEVKNRGDAEKAILAVFVANRKEIQRSLTEYISKTGGIAPDDLYYYFEGNVLDKLSAKYGGNDTRLKVKKGSRFVENDVDFDEALNKALRSPALTSFDYTAKKNFLAGIKNNYGRYWSFLKQNMRSAVGETYEGLYLEDVWYDEGGGYYLVRLANGQLVRFVHERGPNGSPEWRAYDDATGKLLNI